MRYSLPRITVSSPLRIPELCSCWPFALLVFSAVKGAAPAQSVRDAPFLFCFLLETMCHLPCHCVCRPCSSLPTLLESLLHGGLWGTVSVRRASSMHKALGSVPGTL